MPSAKNKHRIVVVEDDRTSRKLLTRILEQAGYDALECGEGRDALHIAEMNAPRAMVIDVMLPDMQGQKIVEELTHNKDCRFTKYIFLTGILSKKDSSKNYFFKIDGKRYRALPKPVRKGQLLKHLAAAVIASMDEEILERRAKDQGENTHPVPEAKPAEEENPEEDVVLSV